MPKGQPVHIRFEQYADDWITRTAKANRVSKPELVRILIAEKLASIGIDPPKRTIQYTAPRPARTISPAEILGKSKGL